MAFWIVFVFFIPSLAVAENNTCPLYLSGYDGSCMIRSEIQDGDVIFGIMGNMHETMVPSPWCGATSSTFVQPVEMVRWILKKLDGYVDGVTFGYRIHDSCRRVELVSRGLLALVPQLERRNCEAPRVVGIIDQNTSNQAASLAAGLKSTKIPVISTHATAPSLSNKVDYPTFFRTIQPDSVAVEAMRDIIVQLDMKYVVIVHTGDFYGRQGKDHMVAALHRRNICVASALEITSDPSTVTAALQDMQARLDKVGAQGILGVIYYGQVTEARELVRQADGLPGNRGRQFLWLMSEAVGREDYILENLDNIRRNILTITPVYHEISEFTDYWLELLYEHIQNPDLEEVFYIREYIEQLLECGFSPGSTNPCQDKTESDIGDAYVESGYGVVVLDGVYAFAAAVKNLHKDKCGVNSPGMCEAMRQALETDFLDTVKAVDFSYPHDFPFVPGQFRSSPRRIAFNQTTYDPLITESSPSHIIYKYVCVGNRDCHYRKIAQYQNNELVGWDLDHVNFYPDPISNGPLPAVDLQSIFCTSLCTECHLGGPIPFAYIPGEFFIAAILPFHERFKEGFLECNSSFYRSRMIHSTETLLYAVDLFNDPNGGFGNHYLHGRLGVVIVDSCHDGVYAHHRIADLHSGQIKLITPDGNIIDSDSIVLYVGGHYSSTALGVTSVLEALKLPQLGYAATSVKLFDYPHFLRTIPADDVQARVIIDFVKEMGWQQIAILYQDDSYGQNGFNNLLEFATEAHICISENISIPVSIGPEDVVRVITRLFRSARDVQVVVLFAGYDEIETILTQVGGLLDTGKHFTWIGSEAWGQSPKFLEAETGLEALGAITVSPRFPRYPQAISYFRSLKPENNQRDPFFITFWERHFQCFLVNSATAEAGGNWCDQSLSLDDFNEFYEGAQLLIPGVLASAIGIGNALHDHGICGGDIETCPAIKTDENLQKIITAIKEVSLRDPQTGISSKVFTSRSDGNIDYVVNNVQKVLVGQQEEYHYVQVADFRQDTGLMRNDQRVIFYDQHENEKEVSSACVQDCELCSPNTDMTLDTTMIQNGTVVLLALLPVHDRLGASRVSVNGLKRVETFRMVLERVNSQVMNDMGITIGYQVRDSFGNEDIGSWYTLTTMSTTAHLLQLPIADTTILSYITAGPDAVTSGVHQVTSTHHRLHVDSTASISNIFGDDAEKYFVPVDYSTQTEAQVIVSVLQAFEVRYISVIYTDDLLMNDKFEQLKQVAEQANICIISSLELPSPPTSTVDFIKASLRSWIGSHLRVPVTLIMTSAEIAGYALKEFDSLSTDRSQTVLMGGSDLQAALASISDTFTDISHRALIITPVHPPPSSEARDIISDFHRLTTVSSTGSLINPWFDETIWSEVLAVTSSDVYDDVIESMIAAVYSIARGLIAFCGSVDVRTCLPQLDTAEQVERLAELVKDHVQTSAAHVSAFHVSLHTYDNFGAKWTTEQLGTYDRSTAVLSMENNVNQDIMGMQSTECPVEGGCSSCNVEGSQGTAAWLIAVIVIIVLVIVIVGVVLGYVCYSRRSSKRDTVPDPDTQDDYVKEEGPYAETVIRGPLPNPPNGVAVSAYDRSTPRPTSPKYMHGSISENGQVRLHPMVPQNKYIIPHTASPSRQLSNQSLLHIDPTYGRSGDPYNVSSSLSSNHDELANIFIKTGSETYANNSSIRANIERHPSLNAHGGAGTYVTTSHTSPTTYGPQAYCKHLPDETARKPAPGVAENLTLNDMTIFDPPLLQKLLEDLRKTSPDVYQRYVKPGNMAAIAVPTPGKEPETRFAFDNKAFKDDFGGKNEGHHRQGHPVVETDSGVAVDPVCLDPNYVAQGSPLPYNPVQSTGHIRQTPPEKKALEKERIKSPHPVDAGTDSPAFSPVHPKGTPSVSPTLSHTPHDESHSSASHGSTSPPPLIGSIPVKPRPKVPARPNKEAIRKSAIARSISLPNQDQPHARLSPTSVENKGSQSAA